MVGGVKRDSKFFRSYAVQFVVAQFIARPDYKPKI